MAAFSPPCLPPSAGLPSAAVLARVCPVQWAEEAAAARWGVKSLTLRHQGPPGLPRRVPPRRWWTRQTLSAPPRPRSRLPPSWRTACVPVSTQPTRRAPRCSWVSRSCTQQKSTGAAFLSECDNLLISTNSLHSVNHHSTATRGKICSNYPSTVFKNAFFSSSAQLFTSQQAWRSPDLWGPCNI